MVPSAFSLGFLKFCLIEGKLNSSGFDSFTLNSLKKKKTFFILRTYLMSRKNFESLNEFSERLFFFFFLKQEVVLGFGQTQSTLKGPSSVWNHITHHFAWAPMALAEAIFFLTPHLRVRDALTFHLRGIALRMGNHSQKKKKKELFIELLLCANICFHLYGHTS